MTAKLENMETMRQYISEPIKTRYDLRLDFNNDRFHGAYFDNEMSPEAVANSLQVMVDSIRGDIKSGLL